MGINNIQRVVVDTNVLHHSKILSSLVGFKENLEKAPFPRPSSTEAQKQFCYAAISTQDFSTYYLCVVMLPQKPSEIWQDVNNIPELKKEQDLISLLRVSAACFARLFIQSRTFAEGGLAQPQIIDMTTEHSYEDIVTVLQYLNENDTNIPPYWSRMTKDGVYLGQTELSGLQPYIPVLSPLQLQHKQTIPISPSARTSTQSEYITYIELLRGLEYLSKDTLANHQEVLKEYQGNYSLHYYPALPDLNDTARPQKEPYLVLSHLAPMQILHYINMNKLEGLSKEEKDVIRFVKHFVTTKNAIHKILARHGMHNLIDTCELHHEHNEALRVLHSSSTKMYEQKARETLTFALDSTAYIASPQDFTGTSSIVKILYTQDLHNSIYLNDLFKKIQAIRSYTQAIINDSRQLQQPCYFYLGISQEFTNTFHLVLIVSQKKPETIASSRHNIDSLPIVEQNVLHFAFALEQIEKAASQPITPLHSLDGLINRMNVLNSPHTRPIYNDPSLINSSIKVPLSICKHALSELDLENKSFITCLQPAIDICYTESFNHTTFLSSLVGMTYIIEYRSNQQQSPPLNKAFYYYPCLGKKSQNTLYIHMAISHKAPQEVVNIQKQAIEKLSKEEQGILLCGNLYLESKQAASNGDDQCQASKRRKTFKA